MCAIHVFEFDFCVRNPKLHKTTLTPKPKGLNSKPEALNSKPSALRPYVTLTRGRQDPKLDSASKEQPRAFQNQAQGLHLRATWGGGAVEKVLLNMNPKPCCSRLLSP